MLSIRLIALSGIVACAIACGGGYSTPSPSPSPLPSPTPPAGGSSSSIVIPAGASALGNRAFSPDDITVAAGTTVTWTNTDSVAHTSTSNVDGWNSGIVGPSAQFSFTFPTAGTFEYHCAIHPGMVGTVTVR
jgi:plastocyanin